MWGQVWTLNVFGASLSFELLGEDGGEMAGWAEMGAQDDRCASEQSEQSEQHKQSKYHDQSEYREARFRAAESLGYSVVRESTERLDDIDKHPQEYDNWLLEKKVKVRNTWTEEDVGDSCCFGTRTVDMGMDCIWKLHGGI